MNDSQLALPAALNVTERDAAAAGFTMIGEHKTGALLRTLAASKPGGMLLELGTGTGASTAWILDGMDNAATLLTVDNEAKFVEIARRHLGHDRRVTFHVEDGVSFLRGLGDRQFDLIFADTWPGKFDHLKDALEVLSPGGLYVIDDLLPQPNWPDCHAPKVPVLITNSRPTRGSFYANYPGHLESSSLRAAPYKLAHLRHLILEVTSMPWHHYHASSAVNIRRFHHEIAARRGGGC